MRTIAKQAGVGLGTIYRHFPTQEALYKAVVIERMRRLVTDADTLRTAEDPAAAFFRFFTHIVDNAKQKKTLVDGLAEAGIDHRAGLSDIRRQMREAIEALLTRAQDSGAPRSDLRMPEVLALLSAACMAAERDQWPADLQSSALALLFDGFRPR